MPPLEASQVPSVEEIVEKGREWFKRNEDNKYDDAADAELLNIAFGDDYDAVRQEVIELVEEEGPIGSYYTTLFVYDYLHSEEEDTTDIVEQMRKVRKLGHERAALCSKFYEVKRDYIRELEKAFLREKGGFPDNRQPSEVATELREAAIAVHMQFALIREFARQVSK